MIAGGALSGCKSLVPLNPRPARRRFPYSIEHRHRFISAPNLHLVEESLGPITSFSLARYYHGDLVSRCCSSDRSVATQFMPLVRPWILHTFGFVGICPSVFAAQDIVHFFPLHCPPFVEHSIDEPLIWACPTF